MYRRVRRRAAGTVRIRVYLITMRIMEYSTPPVELQVGIPSGWGKATFSSCFRLRSPITARIETLLDEGEDMSTEYVATGVCRVTRGVLS